MKVYDAMAKAFMKEGTTTLFGLLAVELAVQLTAEHGSALTHVLSAAFFAVALVFIWRSFYAMRIRTVGAA